MYWVIYCYNDIFTHPKDKVEWELCLISMLQQVIRLLLNQSDSLLNDMSVCVNIKRDILSEILLYYIDLFTYFQNQVEWELCLISMLQQVIQLLLNKSDCLLNDVSVCEYIKRYFEWYIVILYWFIYSPPRLSRMRVVFDFNASASDSAPFEPIWLSVEWCVSVYVWIHTEIFWVIYCYIILIYLLTSKIKLNESCVWFQCFNKRVNSFWINPIPCWMMCQCVWIYKEIHWVIYDYIVLIYLLTSKIKLSERCVWFQCFSKWLSSFWIDLIPCWMMCQCVWIYKDILSDILLYYIDLFTHLQDQV
jgi:hypothetical protein